jgi:hypothetical protein
VFARHLDTGETIAIRADEVTPAQSSLKDCVLLTYTKAIRLGRDDPGRRVSLCEEDHELGSGVLRYLSSGLSPTLNDLAWLMIVLSDNIATRALIRELGGAQIVESEMEALGVPHLRLRESPDDHEYKFMATPRDLAEVYTHLDDDAREILYRVAESGWPDVFRTGLTRSTGALPLPCACTPRQVGDASAWTPGSSRPTTVRGSSRQWVKTCQTCGTDLTTSARARSLTSANSCTTPG